MKRLLRYLLTAALVLVNLCLLGYLLRRPLLEGWIREVAAAEIGAALGAEVEIGAIGGNWIDTLRIEGVQIRGGPEDLLREVRDLDIEVRVSLGDLVSGELSGLRSARIVARRVVVETTGQLPGAAEPVPGESAPFDPGIFEGLLAGGAQIRIQDLDYGTGPDRRRGDFRSFLEPGAGARQLHLAHEALELDIEATLASGQPPRIECFLHAEEPSQLLSCFGITEAASIFTEGVAGVSVDVDLDPLRIAGGISLDGLRGTRAMLHHSLLSIEIDEQRLEVETGIIDFDGFRLTTGGLVLPSPLGEEPITLDEVLGDVDLRIEDLDPYRDWLPPAVVSLLPLQGRIHGWLDDGLLHVGECRLFAPGVELEVAGGRLPLEDMAHFADQDLSLDFALDVPSPRAFDIAGTTLLTSGRIEGNWAGSLATPRLRTTLALGPTAYSDYAAGRIAAEATFADGTLQLRELTAEGLTPGRAEAGSQLRGEVTLSLPRGNDPLRIEAVANGAVHPDWLPILGIDPALAARLDTFSFSCDARLAIPADGTPLADGTAKIAGLVLDDLPPAELDVAVKLDSEALVVERFVLETPTRLELRGVVPIAAGRDFNVTLDAPAQDVAFLSALLLPEAIQGQLSLHATAKGTLEAPLIDVSVDGSLEGVERLAGEWPVDSLGPPPTGPWQLRLRARHDPDGIVVDELSVAAGLEDAPSMALAVRGRVPLRWQATAGLEHRPAPDALVAEIQLRGSGPTELGLPWTTEGVLRVEEGQATLERLDLTAGNGSITGSGSVALGWAELLSDATVLGDAEVKGSWQFNDFRLEQLPARLTGLAVAAGEVQGTLTIAGTLAQPGPNLAFDVSKAQIRAPGVPRITDLSAHVEAGMKRVVLSDVTAKMGAAPIRLQATLVGPVPLWDDSSRAELEASLQGEQVLVVSTPTTKVRGDIDLTISGSLAHVIVRGDVGVTTGRFAQRISALPGLDSLQGRGGASANKGLTLQLMEPAIGQHVEFDVKIRTVRDFQVRTSTLDTDLGIDLRLLGTAALARLDGAVTASRGTLRLPGTNMALRSLLVLFDQNRSAFPELEFLAEGRRHGYRVQLIVRGRLDEPEVFMSSIPALPSEDLVVLITTGVLPQRLREQDARGQATMVGAYLAEELAAWYIGGEGIEETDETLFDRFTVEAGREISRDGLETILVEFRVTKNWSLQAERDVFEDYNGGVVFRLRFK